MDHVKYIIFGNQLICFGAAIYSFYCSINILFRRRHLKKVPYLSASLIVYFLYILLFGGTSIIYFIYFFLNWRFDSVIYNGQILYLLGIVPFICTTMNTLMEWVLCVDRCFAVIYHLQYTKKHQAITMSFGLLIVSAVTCLYIHILQEYYPKVTTTKCQFFGCFFQGNSNLLYIKGVCILCSLITATAFALLLKYKFHTTSKNIKRVNKTMLIIIGVTVFNELIPFLIGQIFFWVTDKNISVYTGPFGSVISQITVTISSGIYYNSYRKITQTMNHSNPIVFTTAKTTTI